MKTILIAILAVFVIIAGAFYWYEYRPSQIGKKCAGEKYLDMSYDESYKACVRGKGLEK